MTLSPEIIAILILDGIFMIFATLALFLAIGIARKWDIENLSQSQYTLEKRALLVATIIKYIFICKLLLFMFFIFTADKLSSAITGAMCAAGVINAVSFGLWMFALKILNVYVFGVWLALDRADLKFPNLPLTKKKFFVFIFAYVLLFVEIIAEVSFFTSLDVERIVSCCGTLFSVASSSSFSLLFSLDNWLILSLFYGSFALLFLSALLKNPQLFIGTNIVFILISILSLILYFSTYVYELPTHKCPFCLLQKDYFFTGYPMYILLFLGTFWGISGSVLQLLKVQNEQKFYIRSLIISVMYTLYVSAYPIIFYLKNGVWL